MDPPTFSKTLLSGKIQTIDDHKTAVVVSNKGVKFHTILTYDGVRSGVHSWDFKINNSSIYIGLCLEEGYKDKMGGNEGSIAMDIKDGSIWHDSKEIGKLNYSGKIGDTVSMTLDLNLGALHFSVNGVKIGVAAGIGSVTEKAIDLKEIFKSSTVFAGITMWKENDEAIQGAGFGCGTLQLPWLLDLQKTILMTAGMCAATMVSGVTRSTLEKEMQPWLSCQLFASGSSDIYEMDTTIDVTIEEHCELGLVFEESEVDLAHDNFVAVVKGFKRIGDRHDTRSKLEKCGLVHPGHVVKRISSAAGTFTDFVCMDDLFRRLKEASRPVVLTFIEPELPFSVSDKLPVPKDETVKVEKKSFLSSVATDDKVLKWIVSKDKKGGMERMIYRSQVFQKRLEHFLNKRNSF